MFVALWWLNYHDHSKVPNMFPFQLSTSQKYIKILPVLLSSEQILQSGVRASKMRETEFAKFKLIYRTDLGNYKNNSNCQLQKMVRHLQQFNCFTLDASEEHNKLQSQY